MSCFSKLTQVQEENAKWWRTTRITDCPQKSIINLKSIATTIMNNFIDPLIWEEHSNKGSITLQNKLDRRQIISIFIDKDNRLASEFELQIINDPIVVAIEITYQTPYMRHLIRKDIRTRFTYYMDPEAGHPKFYLAPHLNHFFDIIFLDDKQGDLAFTQ